MDAVGARAIPAATVPAIATDMSTIRICDMTSFSGCFFGGLEDQQYGRGIGSRVQTALLARSWSQTQRARRRRVWVHGFAPGYSLDNCSNARSPIQVFASSASALRAASASPRA